MKWSVPPRRRSPPPVAPRRLRRLGRLRSRSTSSPPRIYEIADFKPSQPVPAGKPVAVSFVIRQPDGHAAHEVQDRPRARTRACT